MRLILTALSFAAIALPAHAQRLDTRVREVWTGTGATQCRLNANSNVLLNESKAEAILVQTPVDDDPRYSASLTMTFSPRAGASVVGLQFMPIRGGDRPGLVSIRLVIDGADSGVPLSLLGDYDHTERGYGTFPEANRAETARRILDARWVEFEVIDRESPQPRRYRFDALRIRDVAEILSIIHYSCTGGRAD